MTAPPTYETEENLATIDDQDLAALVNAAFAMEVGLAHQRNHTQGKDAFSPQPDADTRK